MRRTLLAGSTSSMTLQVGTHYKAPFRSLLLTARQVKWRGKLNLKTEEESRLTVLCRRRPNKVSCRSHSNTPGISMQAFPEEAKRKQTWTTFARIQTGLPTEYFALCSEHFEVSCFSRSLLIETPVDCKRFYLEKSPVPSIYAKPKDSLDIDYPRNEGRLANRFFPRTVFGRFFGTPPRNVSIQNPPTPPPPKKKRNRDMLLIFRGHRSTTLSTRMRII